MEEDKQRQINLKNINILNRQSHKSPLRQSKHYSRNNAISESQSSKGEPDNVT